MEALFEKLKKHRIRFYPNQKQRFRDLMKTEFNKLGYDNITTDRAKNMIVGDVQNSKIVYTAHYDTPPFSPWLLFSRIFGHVLGSLFFSAFIIFALAAAIGILLERLLTGQFLAFENQLSLQIGLLVVLVVPFFFPSTGNANDNTSGVLAVCEIAKQLKEQGREKGVAFILFNSEEFGLIGSGKFKKDLAQAAKISDKDAEFKPKFTLINFDCVGIGTHVSLVYGNKKSKNICQEMARNFKGPVVLKKGNMITAASDQLHFKDNGVGVFVWRRSLLGPLYLPRVHNPFNMKINLDVVRRVCDGVLKTEVD